MQTDRNILPTPTFYGKCMSLVGFRNVLWHSSEINFTATALATILYKYSLLMHCIKIKSPAKFLLNEQYVFVGGNISFLCVLSCSSEEDSQLDYELNGL